MAQLSLSCQRDIRCLDIRLVGAGLWGSVGPPGCPDGGLRVPLSAEYRRIGYVIRPCPEPAPAMNRLVIAFTFAFVLAAAAGVVYLKPQLLRGTPLESYVNSSKPVYQWRNDQGEWQITDRPPPDGVRYETKRYSLDTNVLPPVGSTETSVPVD